MEAAKLNNGYSVNISYTKKDSQKDKSFCTIQRRFYIRMGGEVVHSIVMSTGRTIPANKWVSSTIKVNGSTVATTNNKKINEGSERALEMLQDEKDSLTDVGSIVAYIKTITPEIEGRKAHGFKKVKVVKKGTFDAVLTSHMNHERERTEKPLSEGRKNMCGTIKKLLAKIFNNDIPDVDKWTTETLIKIKDEYKKLKPRHAPITRTTYLGVVVAVLHHAIHNMRIMKPIVIPKNYVGSGKAKGERYIIEEPERVLLFNLQDAELNESEKLAKYVMMFMITTGMGYCDVKNLKRVHVKIRKDGKRYISKAREKSGVIFNIGLSETAQHAYGNLQELARGEGNVLFNLPKLRIVNKLFKKLANHVSMETFTSYDLRHTFAVDFMDAEGSTLQELMDILGHLKIETTQIYARISENRRNKAMQRMERESNMHQLSFLNI